jgi:hypothetical protein
MSKIGIVSKCLLFIFSVSVLLFVSANADDEQLNDSEHEDNSHVSTYDSDFFEKINNKTWFVTTRGTMPVINNATEEMEWDKKMKKCIDGFTDELDPYMMENGGPLNGFGYFFAGCIDVSFDEKSLENVNDSFIDKIYLIISNQCEQEGINDVPVVFMKSTIHTDLGEVEPSKSPDEGEEIIVGEEETVESSDNDKEIIFDEREQVESPDEDEKGTDRETTAHQAPGFTSIMAILGISSFFIAKRLY